MDPTYPQRVQEMEGRLQHKLLQNPMLLEVSWDNLGETTFDGVREVLMITIVDTLEVQECSASCNKACNIPQAQATQ